MWPGFHGLRVLPPSTDSVKGHWPNSGIRVLPMITAPASRSRRTTSPSAAAGVVFARPPNVVTQPATSISSLIATGTPCSGPGCLAGGQRAVALGRLGAGLVGEHDGERVQCRVPLGDPGQAGLDDLDGADLLLGDPAGQLGHGEVGEMRVGQLRRVSWAEG